jgi:hypothetical protein
MVRDFQVCERTSVRDCRRTLFRYLVISATGVGRKRLRESDGMSMPATRHRSTQRGIHESLSGCLRIVVVAACPGVWLCATALGLAAEPADARPFGIQVVDEATGRGVPLVVLTTTSQLEFVTDSQGFVAIDDPDLVGKTIFFSVSSHGYEFPADGFGIRGRAIDVELGETATLEVRRLNIAERLYRITGQGIYADSVRLGRDVPLAEPLLNAQVTGQDSVQAVVYRGRVFWFWGDTNRAGYLLGQFGTSGAVSDLPESGGLDPSLGVDLSYFAGENGFSRPMFELDRKGLVWVDGVFTVNDAESRERLLCHYSVMQDLGTRLAHGLAAFDDERELFEPVVEFANDAPLYPRGQAFYVRDADDTGWVYFATPYPQVRVRAVWEELIDPAHYEGFTPLQTGSRETGASSLLDRMAGEDVNYGWKANTAVLSPQDEQQLVKDGTLRAEEASLRTIDAATGKPIQLHSGSVHWNEFRQRWVMIALELYGHSLLGEIWYLEAEQPEGPWSKGVKIISHEDYSFYNPTQHPFFDQEGGRYIYFEGTYTHTFSGTKHPTPRYDYNQVMYRLDLADERLNAAH